MKFLLSPLRKNHRSTLLALHRSGVVRVFRRHSIFRLWEPLRENFGAPRDFAE